MTATQTHSVPTRLITRGLITDLLLAVSLAARELRGGIRGFGILIACIALGVAVIAGVGSLAQGLLSGFHSQGRVLIGGDVALRRVHLRASSDEAQRIARLGRVAETANMRAMARTTDRSDQAVVEIKAVTQAYPLVGAVKLASGKPLSEVLARDGVAVVAPALLGRLALKVGDHIQLGNTTVTIGDILESEPDKFGSRFAYGPRVLVSLATLQATQLIRPGTIVDWRYAIAYSDGATLANSDLGRRVTQLKAFATDAGFLLQDRRNPSEQVTRVLKRLQHFLTLIGLTTLLLGGIGVANAVAAYIEKHRRVIATYRSLGATSRVITATLLLQMLAIAGLGVAIGLTAGAGLPHLVSFVAADRLPFQIATGLDIASLGTAAAYGLLVALVFLLWPLSQAVQVKPAALFRDQVGELRAWPSRGFVAAQVISVLALVGFAVVSSGMARVALGFIGGTAAVIALFWLLSSAIRRMAAALPRSSRVTVKLAITNLASPGGLTRAIVVSLGAGLSLLVGLSLVDASLVNELRRSLPEKSPDYYAIDIPREQVGRFTALVKQSAGASTIHSAPMLRGRIVRIKGQPVDVAKVPPGARWVLRGDRGLTYAETLPEGSKLTAGKWWPPNYKGEPLVSFGSSMAKRLGLGVGDTITVNILGRNITARIASLREIQWESLGINFFMVFSPNTLAGAPHNVLATVRFPEGTTPAQERAMARAIGERLTSVTMIRVKDAIGAFAEIFERVMMAIRLAGSIALLAGALVLAGAFAAANNRRTLQAVILKAIGATRSRLLLSHMVEYGLLAAVAALLAVGVGTIGAWIVARFVLELAFVFDIRVVAMALGLAGLCVFSLGGYRTWRILSERPVPYLRGQ
ncbi:MAG: ABC transporter permease [Hyphomicrobiaceae bacterium]|nr:ABC transporter permease [Hyphomicrobiaceae bacterium]